MQQDFISVGKILNFHGIKGDVKVGYTQGNEEILLSLKILYVKDGNDFLPLNISAVRFHKKVALIKFKEINSINDVEKVKGLNLYTLRSEFKEKLDKDEFLISDLEGAKVYNQFDDYVGIVEAVGENKANNLLSVKDNNGKSHLIPFVKAIVPEIDLENKKILINQIEGLLD